ncbi:MAG TPA: bifunctional phosphopantothenoylcysteine decarboxylase/phosphopantothenate--cysteine ligase CoaBC [Candidatus Tenderia sp.]|nr:bifunctional phosphopantothenoylcysteine decarboxylase/phosphopantothenate--cysteine ligase CoaBC [Candidatus Tenderia sp.]
MGRRVLVGISGGIAAYKSAELVRGLRRQGAEVRVVMSAGAQQFITPLTLQALSGHRVCTALLDPEAEAAMGHIELARWADTLLVAPASANFIARLAHGFADELLAAVCLATDAPVILAPAMNQQMWANPATQDNCELLRQRNIRLLGPAEGEQACGEVGYGRMWEPDQLVDALVSPQERGLLQGRTVVVTAGPTREAIDPVRYLTNRSSGKMGYAVAAAAVRAGAKVVLVSGPTILPTPQGVQRIDVESAHQMHQAVLEVVDHCDLFIATAAVADYRPVAAAEQKIKKSDAALTLALEPTKDILAEVAARSEGPFTVGFAAETEDVEAYARAKLERKALDMIAANGVGQVGCGFDADCNALTVIWRDGRVVLPQTDKLSLARQLMDIVIERYHAKN